MNTRPLFLALILACLHTVALAQLFKCKGANDRPTFQDSPCAADVSPQERKRPIPGERNESFVPPKKDSRPGANWEPRAPMPLADRIAPPQPAAPTQTNATRSPSVAPSGKSWQEKDQDYQRRRADEETKAYNDKVKATNQMHDCNYARQQLGVLKDATPAFSRDNKGDRHYVTDENRQAEVSKAEQRVAAACN